MIKINRIGEERINNQGFLMRIIEYNDTNNIIVEFQDEYKAIVKSYYDSFIHGKIKNPFHKTSFGVGYIGYTTTRKNGALKESYKHWYAMIQRCYGKGHEKYYKDCTVCDEWLCFENFEKWYEENYYEVDGEIMNLDKDILIKGNKTYSPETCIFVPKNINLLVLNKKKGRGDCLIGVSKTTGKHCFKYRSSFNKTHLGLFKTEIEAFLEYKKCREKYIKRIADEYKDKIPQKLYDALYNWKIEEDD